MNRIVSFPLSTLEASTENGDWKSGSLLEIGAFEGKGHQGQKEMIPVM